MGLPRVGPAGPTLGRFWSRSPAVAANLGALAVLAALVALGGGCALGQGPPDQIDRPQLLDSARARAVTIEGSVCGSAGPSTGSGVALAADRVLTAAHVVASADQVELVHRGRPVAGEVVALDRRRDLALIEPAVALDDLPPAPPFGPLDERDHAVVVAAAVSGDVEAVVIEATVIEIDDVRGTGRSRRSGYVLAASTRPGDSGSGLYDDQGRLTGLLFAVSTDDSDRTWATAAEELEAFLEESTTSVVHRCDPSQSQLVPVTDDQTGGS